MANTQKTFSVGETIIKQGDIGQEAYIIEEGRVDILIENENGDQYSVGTRGNGTIIGEMALVDDQPRTATIIALERCQLIEITREDFTRRLENSDPVIQTVSQVILTRYRDMLKRTENLKDTADLFLTEDKERNILHQSNTVKKLKLANDLKHALKNKEQFYLCYQPIIDLKTGQIDGFEALMRWEHPEDGFISPNDFIPVAEESGLILELSQWVIHESCNALKRIETKANYDHELFMAINCSSADFAQTDFIEKLSKTVYESGVMPGQIHLEITERLLMSQPENARSTLLACREAGYTVSIDDFGTGYSSLSYLHYFPINKLKIDRSFIQNMQKDQSAANLVKSIIMLAHNMDMTTVAEGTETPDEVRTIIEMGCDQVQGYYFSRPEKEKDITSLLGSWTDNLPS